MTHIERIEALLAGKKLDSTAINLWKHFPPYDEKPTTDLVKKCIQFQDRFDWDFVKITTTAITPSRTGAPRSPGPCATASGPTPPARWAP